MRKQTVLLLLWLGCAIAANANMASPVVEGTLSASGISSKDISISAEKINIHINAAFTSALFTVQYSISTAAEGKQIPLLFYAVDYKDSFRVWVDGVQVNIQAVPERYFANTRFATFGNAFQNGSNGDEVAIAWQEHSRYICRLNDLKYFETNLSKGVHHIRVEYVASPWEYHGEWMKTYSFRYSLSPARFWKSFGSLEVSIEQDGAAQNLSTNLGTPAPQQNGRIKTWRFNKLPSEYIEVSYQPAPGKLAATLIFIDPAGVSFLMGIVLMLLHLFLVMQYRRRHLAVRFSPVVIIGSIVVPLLALIGYMWSYGWIDGIIGADASGRHGYTFLVILLYPIILPVYWFAMWLIDRLYKRKILHAAIGAGVDD